jgi:hypothetical protein
MDSDCFVALQEHGMLLKSDPKLPSVVALVAGGPVKGSWWAHPDAHLMFRTMVSLSEHRDVLLLKLIAGKDTFVHRRLWPEIFAIATAEEAWQWLGLSKEARELHRRLTIEGVLESSGAAPRELELRLLIYSAQIHTQAGFHAKHLESWEHWRGRAGLAASEVDVAEAKRTIEAAVPGARFPWRISGGSRTPSRSRRVRGTA